MKSTPRERSTKSTETAGVNTTAEEALREIAEAAFLTSESEEYRTAYDKATKAYNKLARLLGAIPEKYAKKHNLYHLLANAVDTHELLGRLHIKELSRIAKAREDAVYREKCITFRKALYGPCEKTGKES